MQAPKFLLVFAIIVLSDATQKIHYVKPNDSPPASCPGHPCHTLNQYTQQTTTAFTAGSTFVFLAGDHAIQEKIHITNVSEVILKGEGVDAEATITVSMHGVFLLCEMVTNMYIEGLKFQRPFNYSYPENESEVMFTFIKVIASKNVAINCTVFENPKMILGRALCIVRSSVTVTCSLFEGNTADYGSAVHASERSNITLIANIFSSNVAKFNGGGIYVKESLVKIFGVQYSCPINFTASMFNSSSAGTALFLNNHASGNGGGIYSRYSSMTFGGTLIELRNNSAQRDGGGMCAVEGPRIVMKALQMHCTNNRATSGGGISVKKTTIILGNWEVNIAEFNFMFSRNTARQGGAMYSFKSSVEIHGNSSFVDNTAFRLGGAICMRSGNLTISGSSTFLENKASIGGAIGTYASNGRFTMSGSADFYGNRASSQGGALYISVTFSLFGSAVFSTNEAQYGGAIKLYMSRTILVGNVLLIEENSADDGGGIYIEASHFRANMVTMHFANNIARRIGGGMIISDYKVNGDYEILIRSVNFVNNTAEECGGAVFVQNGMNIHFNNITAIKNSASALCINEGKVSFSGNTNISKNNGQTGGGIMAQKSVLSFSNYTVFSGNSASNGGAIYSLYETILILGGYLKFTYNTANNGGALYALGTKIRLSTWSTATFKCNSAKNGGAVYVNSASSLRVGYLSFIRTVQNHASLYGGAIFHEDTAVLSQCNYETNSEIQKLPYCFIELLRTSIGEEHYDIGNTIMSVNDSAGRDGSFMYGGLLDRCFLREYRMSLQERRGGSYNMNGNFLVRSSYFYVTTFDDTIHEITSQPYQLSLCRRNHVHVNCSQVMLTNIQRGQWFPIHLLALNQLGDSISTVITAKVSYSARLKLNQGTQQLMHNWSNVLYYNLFSTEDTEELILYPDGPCRDTGVARAVVNVIFLPCPDGFNKSGEQCTCEERLKAHVDCDIDEDISLTRKPGSRFWASGIYKNRTYQGLIVCPICPPEYCRRESVHISLDNPDIQCANNRSGMLCGACATNYSLMLGSSRCGECSNTYLALLLPFAAAGIALVVFLSILRLTVATGMINSVILYANIIQVNKRVFLPSSGRNILTVFLAWVNLDLGFETCFYNGMTAHSQTWLQLAFPIYIWTLIGFIILISRYNITVSKLIGHNPIAVLATLLFMSYTKVLKVIVEVYSSVDLEFPENEIVIVWLKDANVPYLQSWHLLLTVVTSLVLVFLFLPYTLLLLLGYKLYRFSGKKYFYWFNRLKPLLDSYYAPYKIHARYWTGLMLLVRCALYLVTVKKEV